MKSNEAFEALKAFMVETYGAKIASGGKEIVKRCHLCGDSNDPSSRHMYIGMKDGIIVYNCFKCQSSGLVDGAFFRNLGCYNVDMINICNENNRNNVSYQSLYNKKRFARNSSPILIYRDAPETNKKLAYMSKRLGVPFTIEDLSRLKIVLNLYDFISANRIGDLTRYKDVCDQIDMFFLGFLSLDNCFINMRRLVPEGKLLSSIDKRYINYNVYGFIDNSARYYVIPTCVDTTRSINIYMAEGPFDILGVYFNTDTDKSNSIYVSIGGKNYMGAIKFFIMNYGFTDFILHVYMDADVDNNSIYRLMDTISCFGIRAYIHRNGFQGEKDYGVPRDRIIDTAIKANKGRV